MTYLIPVSVLWTPLAKSSCHAGLKVNQQMLLTKCFLNIYIFSMFNIIMTNEVYGAVILFLIFFFYLKNIYLNNKFVYQGYKTEKLLTALMVQLC